MIPNNQLTLTAMKIRYVQTLIRYQPVFRNCWIFHAHYCQIDANQTRL